MRMKNILLYLLLLIHFVYAQNSINEIVNDMRLAHEGYPHGVPESLDWYWGPRLGRIICPPGWSAMTGWGQVYEWIQGNPAANTRVQLKDMETWYLSGTDFQWHLLQKDEIVFGRAYLEDFSGNTNKEADLRYEADGGISVTAGNGYNFHFWPSSARVNLPNDNMVGWFVTVQARLILANPDGTDDRKEARYLINMGADWWSSVNAAWADYSTNTDIGISRFKFVTSEWNAFNLITVPYINVPENPPPFQGDRSWSPQILDYDNIIINSSFEHGRERWFLDVQAGCEAAWSVQNNALGIHITKLAPDAQNNPYWVQVKQYVSILLPNTEYRLKFKIRGTTPWLVISIGKNESDWMDAGLYKTISLDQNWSEQSIDFKTKPDIIANNKLDFQLGSQTGEIWIDDVSLIEKDAISASSYHTESGGKPCQLVQNFPNPANPSTTIAYALSEAQTVDLSVFNIVGTKVRNLVHERQNSGNHTIIWNGLDACERSLPSGIYFYQIVTAGFKSTKKLVLVR